MARTRLIHGSDEVMAMFGKPEHYYRGKWEDITITEVSKDEDVPLEVRTVLISLTVPTIFTRESIEKQTGADFKIPERSRLAYAVDVVEVLNSNGRYDEAEQLSIKGAGHPLDMYVFEEEIYELV